MAIRGMDVAATGFASSEFRLDVISNNIANNTTTAFKRSDVNFADLLYETLKTGGGGTTNPTGVGVQLGKGVRFASTALDFTQGPLTPGLDLDVAINGEGFFRVVDSQGGIFYTRVGAFQPKGDSAAGVLNLQLGGNVVAIDPPIVLPGAPGVVNVASDGRIFQGDVFVGQFQLVRFRNPLGLLQVGDSLYAATPASGPEIVGTPTDPQFGSLVGGFLEGSNVDIAIELVDLITASQAFNLNSQSFTTGNAELLTTIELVRRT